MNNALHQLQPYPFEKLRALLGAVTPNPDKRPIALSIGEPKHRSPSFVAEALADNLDQMAVYPTTARHCRRCAKPLPAGASAASACPPAGSTRRATCCRSTAPVKRCSPSPRRWSTAATTHWWSAPTRSTRSTKAPPFSPAPTRTTCRAWPRTVSTRTSMPCRPDVWKRCQILFLCSPGNPTGALIPLETLKKLIALADEYDFVIAADECYSELYFDEADPTARPAHRLRRTGPQGLQALRGVPQPVQALQPAGPALGFRRRRCRDSQRRSCSIAPTTAARCRCKPNWPASPPGATKSTCAPTVTLYREKFDAVLEILSPVLDVQRPDGGFYLWPKRRD